MNELILSLVGIAVLVLGVLFIGIPAFVIFIRIGKWWIGLLDRKLGLWGDDWP